MMCMCSTVNFKPSLCYPHLCDVYSQVRSGSRFYIHVFWYFILQLLFVLTLVCAFAVSMNFHLLFCVLLYLFICFMIFGFVLPLNSTLCYFETAQCFYSVIILLSKYIYIFVLFSALNDTQRLHFINFLYYYFYISKLYIYIYVFS